MDKGILFDRLLKDLLSLTQSEYGFISEVLYTPSGEPYFKSRAITNIAWNRTTREFYEKNISSGLEFYNLNTLFGAVFTSGKPVISNDPSTDPRSGGLPEGHPPLNTFLGLPLYSNSELIGMVGIANRPDGYNESLVEFLQPFLATCGSLIKKYSFMQHRKRAEDLVLIQHGLAIALSDKIELNEVLRLSVETAIRISGLDCGGIYLVDKVSGSMDLAFHKGLGAEFVNAVSHYDADSDNARLVMAGKPIYRQIRKLGILMDEALLCEGLRAVAIIPVQYEGRVIACLNIASHTLEEVPDFVRTALETITSQIGSTITRIKTREALKESERKYRTIFENTGTATIIIEEDTTISLANQEFEKLIGCSKEEIESKSWSKFFVKDELDKLKEYHYLRRIDPGAVPRNYETRLIDREDNVIDVYSTVAMIPGTKKSIASFSDITELKLSEEKLQQSFAKLRKAMGGTIQVVASTVEKRDPYTAGHQRRVADLARTIATEMGLSKNQIDGTRIAGVIHDIGKISIPSEILTKPSRLSDIEFSLIKTHPQVGYDILKDVEFPWPIAQIVLQHHERMDGSGYPLGLSGEDILMEARIMAVADVVEAMSSHRPYRPAVGIDKAFEEISKGKIYDPNVVDTCLRLFREGKFEFK